MTPNLVPLSAINPRYMPGLEEFGRSPESGGDDASLKLLAAHIADHGLKWPIVCNRNLDLVSGWRRLAALRMIHKSSKTVQVISGDFRQMAPAIQEQRQETDPDLLAVTVPMRPWELTKLGLILWLDYLEILAQSRQQKGVTQGRRGPRPTGIKAGQEVGACLGIRETEWNHLRPVAMAALGLRVDARPNRRFDHDQEIAVQHMALLDSGEVTGLYSLRDKYVAAIRKKNTRPPAQRSVKEWEKTMGGILSTLGTVCDVVSGLGPAPDDLDPALAQQWVTDIRARAWSIRSLSFELNHKFPVTDEGDSK